MKQLILNLEDEQVESIANFIFKQNECPTINLRVNSDYNSNIEITRTVKSMSITDGGYSIILK